MARKSRGVNLTDDIWIWVTKEAARRSERGVRVSAAGLVEAALRDVRARLAAGEAVEGLPRVREGEAAS